MLPIGGMMSATRLSERVTMMDGPEDTSIVLITTGKPIRWWRLLANNMEAILKASYDTSDDDQEKAANLIVSVSEFHDVDAISALNEAWERMPDDVADRTHPDFATFVVMHRLIVGDV